MNGYAPAPVAAEKSAASLDHEPQQPSYQLEASSYGYEPPTSSYEPSSYQPYQPDDATEEKKEEQKLKKKSFMDDNDDDDLAARATALKKQQKAEADRQADEAFRKAAEADGESSMQ
jgi:hypothetical protein